MRYATVNPGNTTEIDVLDLDGRQMLDGSTVRINTYPGEVVTVVNSGADSHPVLHLLNESPTVCPAYTTTSRAYSWNGSSVDEAVTCAPFALEDLKRAKEGELRLYGSDVYNAAWSHSAGGNDYWTRNDYISLTARNLYGAYLAVRGLDMVFDAVDAGIADGGGTNAEVAAFWASLKAAQSADPWWDRDIKVFLYRKDTLQLVRDTATANQWRDLMRSGGTFAWQVRNASDRVQDDIELYYSQGEAGRAALAGIDVADPSYNWPPHYTGPLPG